WCCWHGSRNGTLHWGGNHHRHWNGCWLTRHRLNSVAGCGNDGHLGLNGSVLANVGNNWNHRWLNGLLDDSWRSSTFQAHFSYLLLSWWLRDQLLRSWLRLRRTGDNDHWIDGDDGNGHGILGVQLGL